MNLLLSIFYLVFYFHFYTYITTATTTIIVDPKVIPVTDTNLYYSLYNWDLSTISSARTSNPGASLKFAFTNTTSISIVFNTSLVASTSSSCLSIAYILNDNPWAYTLLNPGNATYIFTISTTLNPTNINYIRLYLHATCEQKDRWLFTNSNSFLVITGIIMDTTGITVPLPSFLRLPFKAMVYGDSISEGTNTQNYNYEQGTCGGTTGLRVSSSVDSWAYSFCNSVPAECSLIAFAAQGYVTTNSYNYGNVPPLLTMNDDTHSAWNKLFVNISRIPLLLQTIPDLIVNALGFNDQNNDVVPTELTNTITTWINTTRLLFINNATVPIIAILTPFGGEMRTNNITRNAIIQGFRNYQQSVPNDYCTILVDTYPYAQLGLQGLGSPTAESCDGTHPLARTAGYIGSMVGSKLKEILYQSNCPNKLIW